MPESPEFTHAVSEDGLTLTTTVSLGEVTGTSTVSWKTREEAEQHLDAAKASAEFHLGKLAAVGRTQGGLAKRKKIGPFTIALGTYRGDYDNWLLRFGPIVVRRTGVSHEPDPEKFTIGAGTRKSAVSLSFMKNKPAAEAEAPRIRREDIKVPLSNPFTDGDKVVVPVGALVWDVDVKNATTIDRKRNVTVRLAGGGYFSPERVGIQPTYGKRVFGAIQAHTPYIQWTTGRTEVTPELLEANGKPVAYAEDQYDIFRRDIESGNYELRGMDL